ncbi:hypothetical protein T484DRAFT_1873602, partial [Baffinella frigidus]
LTWTLLETRTILACPFAPTEYLLRRVPDVAPGDNGGGAYGLVAPGDNGEGACGLVVE